jgi:hypothetical protein
MKPLGKRTRLAGMLVAMAAALALVALPGLASAHHGHDSLADAGTIESFDQETGMLTIDLTGGGSVSGLVTPRTHIHCDNGWHRGRHGLRHHLRHGATASHRGGGEGKHGNGDNPPGHDGTAPGRSEGPGHGSEHSADCASADLTAGKTVKFAELVLVDGQATYKVVGLPKAEEEGEGAPEAPPSE